MSALNETAALNRTQSNARVKRLGPFQRCESCDGRSRDRGIRWRDGVWTCDTCSPPEAIKARDGERLTK